MFSLTFGSQSVWHRDLLLQDTRKISLWISSRRTLQESLWHLCNQFVFSNCWWWQRWDCWNERQIAIEFYAHSIKMDQQWYEQTESVVKSVKKETAEKKIDRLIQNFKHFYHCKLALVHDTRNLMLMYGPQFNVCVSRERRWKSCK